MRRNEVFRFIISGGICTMIDFAAYLMLSIVLNQDIAKAISITIAMIISYQLNAKWTFRFHGNAFNRFILSQLGNLAVNVLTNHIVFIIINEKVISMFLAASIAGIFNYVLQNKYVFVD